MSKFCETMLNDKFLFLIKLTQRYQYISVLLVKPVVIHIRLYLVNTYSKASFLKSIYPGTIRPLSNSIRIESQALNATQRHKPSYQNPATNPVI